MKRGYLRGRRVTEDSEQVALFRWMAVARYRGRPISDFYWHTPNGGRRSPREGRKLELMGVKPGVPDIFGCVVVQGFHGHFIELKAKDGKVSAEQRDVCDLLRAEGYRVDVSFGQDEARKAVLHHLGLGAVTTVYGFT